MLKSDPGSEQVLDDEHHQDAASIIEAELMITSGPKSMVASCPQGMQGPAAIPEPEISDHVTRIEKTMT